jgi:arabinogalactan endo-1,4-beta-galactosidase
MRRVILGALSIAALAAAGITGSAAAKQVAGTVVNPGFEADGGVATPSGWRDVGDDGASFVEGGGHAGSWRLSHWSPNPYDVVTTQTVDKLANKSWYTLSVWTRRSAGQNDSEISLACGLAPVSTVLPAQTTGWLRVVVSAEVRGQSCEIRLSTKAAGGEWANFDDVTLTPGRAALSVLGADVSSLAKSEDLGGVYRETHGRAGDALRILRAHGLNWVRLRVWVDPADGYHDKAELLTMARRAKALGLKVLVDLHYSDFWADPGKQWTPDAWAGQTYDALKQTMVAYTGDILGSLVAQGTPADMVQLGNEVNSGLLWDYAATWTGCSTADDGAGGTRMVCHTEDWDHVADLLTAASNAARSASPQTKVMLHLANGGDNGAFRWWFDNATQRGVPYDVIGVSHYVYWHGDFAALQYNLDDIVDRYGKDVIVVETAYPFTTQDKDGWENIAPSPGTPLVTGYDATTAGQAAMFRDILSVVRAVPNGHGLGAFWWDATWTGVPGNGWTPRDPTQGNAWENQALFGYDDRVLPAADELRP